MVSILVENISLAYSYVCFSWKIRNDGLVLGDPFAFGGLDRLCLFLLCLDDVVVGKECLIGRYFLGKFLVGSR